MPTVSLASLVSALQLATPGEPVRIDRQTGEVIPFDDEAGPGSGGEEQHERTITIRLDDLAMAKSFCATITDLPDRKRLETALLSHSPVEAFEQAVYRIQVAHRWFAFRDLEMIRLAKAQLEAQGIPFDDDLI
jgi:hypothetical protein